MYKPGRSWEVDMACGLEFWPGVVAEVMLGMFADVMRGMRTVFSRIRDDVVQYYFTGRLGKFERDKVSALGYAEVTAR